MCPLASQSIVVHGRERDIGAHVMHPATTQYIGLTQIQQSVHADELHERAERHRRLGGLRGSRRSSKEIEATHRAALPPAYSPLSLAHGFFGREHGSHA
jgi:hypothetical protein